eukprot:844264-Amphidinium_carterae.3
MVQQRDAVLGEANTSFARLQSKLGALAEAQAELVNSQGREQCIALIDYRWPAMTPITEGVARLLFTPRKQLAVDHQFSLARGLHLCCHRHHLEAVNSLEVESEKIQYATLSAEREEEARDRNKTVNLREAIRVITADEFRWEMRSNENAGTSGLGAEAEQGEGKYCQLWNLRYLSAQQNWIALCLEWVYFGSANGEVSSLSPL